MNYVGMLVEHNAFGQGKIIKQDSRFIEVAFDDGGIKRFVYPDAFNSYLSFVNEEYLPEESAPKRSEKYVGQTVRHSIYGLGTITSQEAHFVSVSFGGREKRFVFPDAFNNYLTFTDDGLQKEIEIRNRLLRISGDLNQWKSFVSAIVSVTELDDYSSVILQASKIAEQIIQVIGIENGYSFEDRYYTDSDGNRQKYNSPLSFIKAERVMPLECTQFCIEIFYKRNQAAHSMKVSYGEMVGFINTFKATPHRK